MSDQIRASLVAVRCLVRGLPLFFTAAPKTPLRVLGIIAFDILHVLRQARPLPRQRIAELAVFLDFEGCANAAWDHKDLCDAEYQAIRQRLEQAGLRTCLEEYLGRLRELESRRPSIGGDERRFDDVRAYREAVARLALETAAAIALNAEYRAEAIRAEQGDSDVDTLFRILMQCQIIDDVLDYAEDLSAGLPSFLTASASLPQAIELTGRATRHYAKRGRGAGKGIFPLHLALCVVTALTTLVIHTYGITHSQRLQDLRKRRASAEERDAHYSGGNVRPARSERRRQVDADAHPRHVTGGG